jgi:hypothetical protein
LTDPKQAAENLELAVWDFLAECHNNPDSLTEEHRATIRTAAFTFPREVKSSDAWLVTLPDCSMRTM